MLTIPDLFHYWLTGNAVCEFTNATTTQLVDARTRQLGCRSVATAWYSGAICRRRLWNRGRDRRRSSAVSQSFAGTPVIAARVA